MVRQGDAAMACANLYAGAEYLGIDFVSCDLVNSYAWDTAVIFIVKCSEQTDYGDAVTGTGWDVYNTGTTGDEVCNIFDLGGNLREWSTEYSSYTATSGLPWPVVCRGGFYDDRNAAGRFWSGMSYQQYNNGFRGVLDVNPIK